MNVLQVSFMALSAIILIIVMPAQASFQTFVIFDPKFPKDEWAIRKSKVHDGTDYGADTWPPYRWNDDRLAIDVKVWLSDGDYVFDVYYKANPNIYIQIDATNNWNNGLPEPKIKALFGCDGDITVWKQVDKFTAIYAIKPWYPLTTAGVSSAEATVSAAPDAGDHDEHHLPSPTFAGFGSGNDERGSSQMGTGVNERGIIPPAAGSQTFQKCRAEYQNIVVPLIQNNDRAQWRCRDDCETRLGNKWSFTKQWWQCGEKDTCASGQGSVCRCERKNCTTPTPNPTMASSPASVSATDGGIESPGSS